MNCSNAIKVFLLVLAFPLGAWGGTALSQRAIVPPMPPVLERFEGSEDALFRSCAARGNTYLVEHEIRLGADVNRVHTWRNRTALHDGALGGYAGVIDVLLQNGAEIELRDQFGYTPLALAVLQGHEEAAARLLEGRANPHARDNEGTSIFYIAARQGYVAIVDLLLRQGLHPEDGIVNGLEALHVAALNGHLNVVETLVDGGAHLWIQDPIGRTALDYAQQFNHPEVVAFLEEAITFQAIQALFHEEDIGERPELLDTAVDFNAGDRAGMPNWGSL